MPIKDLFSTISYIELYDSIKCFGVNNRKGKQLKTKNNSKNAKEITVKLAVDTELLLNLILIR